MAMQTIRNMRLAEMLALKALVDTSKWSKTDPWMSITLWVTVEDPDAFMELIEYERDEGENALPTDYKNPWLIQVNGDKWSTVYNPNTPRGMDEMPPIKEFHADLFFFNTGEDRDGSE